MFNINNNEVQVSGIKFFSPEEEANLTKDKQYEEQKKDFDSKSIGAPDCHFFLFTELVNKRMKSKFSVPSFAIVLAIWVKKGYFTYN